jgi:hypothetical protein
MSKFAPLANPARSQEKLIDDFFAYVGVRLGSLAEALDELAGKIARLERVLPAAALAGSGQVLVIEGNGLRP